MTRLGLEVNETKTRLARDNITFLGYTLGQFDGKEGRPYIGTHPSRKVVKSRPKRIHDRTARRWYADNRATPAAVRPSADRPISARRAGTKHVAYLSDLRQYSLKAIFS